MFYDSISDGTRVDNSDVNAEGLPVGAYDGAALILVGSTLIGVADFSKLGEDLGCKEDISLYVFSLIN